MTEKAILAIEEALLANLFTQKALIALLMKKGIISREDLENEILKNEADESGAGKKGNHTFLEKRHHDERRTDLRDTTSRRERENELDPSV